MGLFIFNKSLVSNRSTKDGVTDIDLFAAPVENLANVTSTEGLVTLYFKDGNSYTALAGGDTNIRGYEYAQVELTTNVGNEQFVVKELGRLLAQIQKGERTTIIIDTPEQNYNILGVTGINAIKRFNDLTTLVTDSSTGTSESAERIELEVRFDEAVVKGDPLYITGYNNGQNRITVAKADASDSAKMPSIGLADAAYSTNDNGKALTMGSLVDVDTSSFSEGDVLYVAAAGGLTSTKPTGSNLIQNIGKVGRSNLNNGEIVVMAIGRSNDVPNLPTGKFFIGSASNTQESAYTLPTADGSANQVLATNGAGAVSFVTRATEAYVDTAANTLTENSQTGTSYTTVLADAGKMITCNNASAITVNIPRSTTVAYEAGTVLSFVQKGAGQITLTPISGVTLNGANGLKTASQYSVISCWKEDTDTWIVYGDTTT